MFLHKKTILLMISGMLILTVGLVFPTNVAAQWERSFGGPDEPDDADEVIGGQYGSLLGWAFTIGGTHSANAASAFNSNPPNLLISYADPLGISIRGIMHDVEMWDQDASIVELRDGTGVAWTTGVRNPDNNSFDVLIARSDYGGGPAATRVFGGFQDEGGTSIIQLADAAPYNGDLLIVGTSESFGNGSKDGFIAKVDEVTLVIDWVYYFSGAFGADRNDSFHAVHQATPQSANPNYVYAVGSSNSLNSNGNYDKWLVGVDPKQTTPIFHSAKAYGGSENDHAYSVVPTTSGGCGSQTHRINLVGETYSGTTYANDISVLVMDDLLTKVSSYRYDVVQSPNLSSEVAYDAAQRSNTGTIQSGDLVLVGQTNYGNAPFGQAIAMMIPEDGGAPIQFQNTYGDPDTYSTAKSIGFNYNLLLPYYIAGRNDVVQAGDQYLLNLQNNGSSGSAGGSSCPIPVSPMEHSTPHPVVNANSVMSQATLLVDDTMTINITVIGDQVDLCGP